MNNHLLSNEENERMTLCIKLYHNGADLTQLRQLLTIAKQQKYARQARENHHTQQEHPLAEIQPGMAGYQPQPLNNVFSNTNTPDARR